MEKGEHYHDTIRHKPITERWQKTKCKPKQTQIINKQGNQYISASCRAVSYWSL